MAFSLTNLASHHLSTWCFVMAQLKHGLFSVDIFVLALLPITFVQFSDLCLSSPQWIFQFPVAERSDCVLKVCVGIVCFECAISLT